MSREEFLKQFTDLIREAFKQEGVWTLVRRQKDDWPDEL